jgi:hypothetical protein
LNIGAEVVLGPLSQRVATRRVRAAHQVELVVEDEEIAQRAALRVRLGLEHLNQVDVEEAPEDFVHREQRSGHPAGARQEPPPIDPELLARRFRELLDPRLDLLLLGLRDRHVLAVRHDLRRHRRLERLCRVGTRTELNLLVVEQTVIRFPLPTFLVPLLGHGASPTRSH